MNKLFTLAILLCIVAASCTTSKNLAYFQDASRTSVTMENAESYMPVTIQPQDILSVNISSLNADASAVYNHGVVNSNVVNTTGSNSNTSGEIGLVSGYLVDKDGFIQLPVLGNFKVGGLTVPEFKKSLTDLLTKYLKEPFVTANIVNFKVTVLGDVGHPGIIRVQNERLSLTDAIGLSGDLTITAERNNILLIRELAGKREFIPIDLTSKNVFNSPYFYLKNNDILYVTPGEFKSTLAKDNFTRNFGIATSILSIGLALFTTIFFATRK